MLNPGQPQYSPATAPNTVQWQPAAPPGDSRSGNTKIFKGCFITSTHALMWIDFRIMQNNCEHTVICPLREVHFMRAEFYYIGTITEIALIPATQWCIYIGFFWILDAGSFS